MESYSVILSDLHRKGWAVIDANSHRHDSLPGTVIRIASFVGTPVIGRSALVEQLSPRPSEKSRPASLSRKYGLGAFPLHCETAHWPQPCRFVVIGCVDPGSVAAPTVLLDTRRVKFSRADRRLAESAIFYVRNGRRSFYGTILSPRNDFVRYDPGCLEPLSKDGVEALELYDQKKLDTFTENVSWRAGMLLVIDNWRILHARGSVSVLGQSRALLRSIAT